MGGFVYKIGGFLYDLLDNYFERTRYAKIRKQIIPSLKDNILEVGCGTGRNFSYYSKDAKVSAVDLSEKMLKTAKKRAVNLKNINIKQMDVTKLKFPRNSFDFVVASFVLCTMPQNLANIGLTNLVDVSKTGAKLYFLEYDYSKKFLRKLIMKTLSPLLRFLFGLRFNNTLPLIKKESRLSIEKNEFVHDDTLRLIVVKKM